MKAYAEPQYLTSPEVIKKIHQIRGGELDEMGRYTYLARPEYGETPERVVEVDFWERSCVPHFVGKRTQIKVEFLDAAHPALLIEINGETTLGPDLRPKLPADAVAVLS